MGTALVRQEEARCLLDRLPLEILEAVIEHISGILVRSRAYLAVVLNSRSRRG